ncbi:MAG: Orotate phosphoribosyltransferase [Deltaproteobacteria bacterium ADurb.BinA179]|jgi:orotate phosphoribosyltransferase|nr:orotate phosphoribosyltransferase [Deltaproteobacteria bacterium]MDI9543432.1 orotate phosphoribosyltransferase [Pseudomonadota bacterium]NLW68868.1 orotate phosphoribosyltransferase [Bacteriovoracaceae bacterium]OPZ30194.1 MAG: Orotate phosphoribosyltransferase [Deltaproteobacteria bacterium ADurb.BinA179]HRR20216.1 orotate phosphoribosyltransferase [Desulfomonilia bacterium]
MNMREELLGIVRRDAVRFGKFILASGKESDLYVDLRKVTLQPRAAFLIGSIIYEMIKDRGIQAIGGMSIGADPIATAASMVAYQNGMETVAFLVRKEKKEHGTRNLVEGPIEKGYKAVIVEDVITTGSSTVTAIRHAEGEGMRIDMVIGVLDRMEGGKSTIESLGYEVRTILSREDL